jgi:hypothetical protein
MNQNSLAIEFFRHAATVANSLMGFDINFTLQAYEALMNNLYLNDDFKGALETHEIIYNAIKTLTGSDAKDERFRNVEAVREALINKVKGEEVIHIC